MASLNKVFLIGNLTRPPELRYTPSGTAVADLRLAVNRNYTTQGGEKREETSFITVVVWGKQAETCGEYLDKGSPILVDYKDVRRLRSFVSDRGKIIPRRISGSCARHQRQLTHAIKRARTVALVPYLATE